MADGVLIGDKLLGDVRRWTKRTLAQPTGPNPAAPNGAAPRRNWQLCRVDTGVSLADGISTFAPAHVVRFNAGTGTLDELGAVHLVELNDSPLPTGKIYLASQSGLATLNGENRPVFTVGQPCCDEPPDNCCDFSLIGTACVTFNSICNQSVTPPACNSEPILVSAEYRPVVGNRLVNTTVGPVSPEGFHIACLNGQLVLILNAISLHGVGTTPPVAGDLIVPLELFSCDPFQAAYMGPGFDWVVPSGHWRFTAFSISVVGPGSCP